MYNGRQSYQLSHKPVLEDFQTLSARSAQSFPAAGQRRVDRDLSTLR